jgi:hypothetical protein
MFEGQGFKDRAQAGKQLAKQLSAYAHRPDVVVLALPRGGVPVAFEVAAALGAELDILLVRKLGMPHQEEYAIGAVGSGGVRVLQPGVPGLMGVTQEQVEAITAREVAEIGRRDRLYRGRGHDASCGATGAQARRGRDRGGGAGGAARNARHPGARGRPGGVPGSADVFPRREPVVPRVRPDQRQGSAGLAGDRLARPGRSPGRHHDSTNGEDTTWTNNGWATPDLI